MKLLSVDNYIDFECIGGACPISCCGGNWGIPIDDESMEYYMSVDGEFGDILRDGIVRMNDTNMFRLDERTRDCVFLNEDKLCRIYRALGENALCLTCKTFPRSMYEAGDMMFCYLSNSCPEVNRMIMQRSEPVGTLYDDSEEDDDSEVTDYDKKRFDDAIKAFNTGMHIIRNRDIPVKDRLFLILFYTERFQELVKQNKDVADLIVIFSKPDVYRVFLGNRMTDEGSFADKIRVFMIIYRTLMADSYDHPMWIRCTELADRIVNKGLTEDDQLRRVFSSENRIDIEKEVEQLIIYRFIAVFMKGFENDDYLDWLAYEIIMIACLETYAILSQAFYDQACTQEDRILFYSLCRRIDHTTKQKEKLVEELRCEGFYDMDRLIRLIS